VGDDLIFSEIKDWKRYRTLEDLRSVVGVSDIADIPRLVVKELVDNALDACEICRIGRLDEHGIFVEDEGDGIPGNDEDIARMFSVRRALVSSKYVRKPTRGALGNGLRFVTGAVLSTGGLLRVSTRGRTLDLRPEFTTGDTTILASRVYARQGTRIELSLPELRLAGALEWGEGALSLAGSGEPFKGLSSAFWYDSGAFFDLFNNTRDSTRKVLSQLDGCSGATAGVIVDELLARKMNDRGSLTDEEKEKVIKTMKKASALTRADTDQLLMMIRGDPAIREEDVLDWPGVTRDLIERADFRERIGKKAADELARHPTDKPAILAALNRVMDSLSKASRKVLLPSERARANRKKLEALCKGKIRKLKSYARPVTHDRLGSVGDRGEKGYARQLAFLRLKPHGATFEAEIPVVIEAWARPTEGPRSQVTFFVNKTPLPERVTVFGEGTKITIISSGQWTDVKLPSPSVELLVNVLTPHIPLRTSSKLPDLHPIAQPIKETIEKALKPLFVKDKPGKKGEIKAAVLDVLDTSIEKVSGNFRYRYALRQLFYVVRAFVMDRIAKVLDYDYFGKIVGAVEQALGRDLKNIFRDARGVLYHPHEHTLIQLGTLTVEDYQRPAWTFNKILYAEKEGFFEILRDENWPERHDCALLTSKGYATRAARDVIDLLGDTTEEITFFCIHDADGYGTMIYQGLQEATTSRPKRKVKIINLGLEPEEALCLRLPTEAVKKKKNEKIPVAGYVDDKWKKWLQKYRIELNAMTTAEFLKWLDRKMKKYDKLIPPNPVLASTLRDDLKRELREAIVERVLREAKVDEQVERKMDEVIPILLPYEHHLGTLIKRSFRRDRAQKWDRPISKLIKQLVTQFGLNE
jgi:hypothetical protein